VVAAAPAAGGKVQGRRRCVPAAWVWRPWVRAASPGWPRLGLLAGGHHTSAANRRTSSGCFALVPLPNRRAEAVRWLRGSKWSCSGNQGHFWTGGCPPAAKLNLRRPRSRSAWPANWLNDAACCARIVPPATCKRAKVVLRGGARTRGGPEPTQCWLPAALVRGDTLPRLGGWAWPALCVTSPFQPSRGRKRAGGALRRHQLVAQQIPYTINRPLLERLVRSLDERQSRSPTKRLVLLCKRGGPKRHPLPGRQAKRFKVP